MAVLLGLFGWVFNFIKNKELQLNIKALWCTSIAVANIITVQYTGFSESKYIGALVFGYVSFRVWGQDKPNKQIARI